MFHDLKEESEVVLSRFNKANGERWERAISVAQVSAPYIHTWYKDWTRGCVVYDGLEMANVSPVTYMSDDPLYLVDTNAVFVDTGRSLCVDRDCNGHQSFSLGKDDYEPRILFTVSFTNESVYTAFQYTRCFFHPVYGDLKGVIENKYGLDKIDQWSSPSEFWGALREHLKRQLTNYIYSEYLDLPFEILAFGEAAKTPEFLQVLRDVADTVYKTNTKYRLARDNDRRSLGDWTIDVVVPEDPTFAAARGAAYWRSIIFNKTYCDDFDRRERLEEEEYRLNKHKHEEL